MQHNIINRDIDKQMLSHTDFLKMAAYKLTHDFHIAEDLLQETFYKAIKNIDKFDHDNLRGWLFTIMRNEFINEYRRKKCLQIIDTDNISAYSEATVNDAIDKINITPLKKAITQLQDSFRVPFLLYCEGYQYHEISEILNLSMSAIKSRIHFARKVLREKLAPVLA